MGNGGSSGRGHGAADERMVAEDLTQRGWSDDDHAKRPKGDPGKVATARRLRKGTTMTLKWIARCLGMGDAGMVSQCLRLR